MPTPTLSVAIVTYQPDLALLHRTLASLAAAAEFGFSRQTLKSLAVRLIDNGPGRHWQAQLETLLQEVFPADARTLAAVVSGHGNVGYGRGHNIAISAAAADYHLILNPDVVLEQNALAEAIGFMEAHPDVALLSPAATGADGRRQYLCKRYPVLFDLLLRGFAPHWMKRLFRARLERYEMKAETDAQRPVDVPIASGCFMFFRLADLKRAGGFSAAYFMYFEDFDLSLRVGRMARIVHLPAVKIVHYGGHAARKGWHHVRMFARSALTFFGRNGWKLL